MNCSRKIGALTVAGALWVIAQTSLAREEVFILEKPEAQSVSIVGEFNQWHGQAMAKQSDGNWTIKVSLSSGSYGYKFLVNGTDWLFDPKNPNRKTVDGIENSVVEIGSDDPVSSSATSSSPVLPAARTPLAQPVTTPSRPASASTSSIASIRGGTVTLSPTPGETLVVEVPLSPAERSEAAKKGSARLTTAKLSLAVPPGFDPQKSWPMLVVSNTENYASADALNQFKQAANEEGWVTLAADPLESEKDEHGNWRWPCLAAGLDYIVSAWPAAKNWPVACGGMSGGAKNSAFLAADVARAHYNLVGMLMMGCNQDMATVAYRQSAPSRFLAVPVFLSSGTADTIATPAQHEYVKTSLKGTGFQKVRLESHSGAHDVYPPHITEALKWFVAQSGSGPKPSPSSAFDTFFKKKP